MLDAPELVREALLSPRDGIRTTTLFTLDRGGADRAGALGGFSVAELLQPGTGYRRFVDASAEWLPRIVATRSVKGSDVDLGAEVDATVSRARTWMLQLAYGEVVVALTLDLAPRPVAAGRPPSPLTDLINALDSGRFKLRLAEATLYEACCEGLDEAAIEAAGPCKIGLDMHHLTFLPAGVLPPTPILNKDLAQRMVSRRDESSRADFLTVRLPAEPNRYADMLTAVTPGATVVCGHPPDVEVLFTVVAAQTLGSLAALRDTQHCAHEMLARVRRAPVQAAETLADRRERLAREAEQLARLELDLSFGVEAYSHFRLYVPSLPVEQYHAELSGALGLPEGVSVTDRMLDRLSATLAAGSALIAAEERAEDEARFAEERGAAAEREQRMRNWSAMSATVAAVAVPLTIVLSFLGANTSDVDPQRSLTDLGHYWPYYAVLVGAVIIAAVSARVYVRSLDAQRAGAPR